MTTRVVITNFGPDPIKIEVQGRDGDGRFTAAREEVLTAGQAREEYVHQTQTLQIIEIKTPS